MFSADATDRWTTPWQGKLGQKKALQSSESLFIFGGVEATKDCLIRPSVRLPFLQQLPRGSPIATKSSCFICHFKTNNASFSFLRSVYKARQGTTTNILRNQFSTVNHSLSEDILPSKLKRLRFFPEKVSAFFGLFPVGFFSEKGREKTKAFSGKKRNLLSFRGWCTCRMVRFYPGHDWSTLPRSPAPGSTLQHLIKN